jgi:hypothetical protein
MFARCYSDVSPITDLHPIQIKHVFLSCDNTNSGPSYWYRNNVSALKVCGMVLDTSPNDVQGMVSIQVECESHRL